jgi:hypothetical protein
MAETFMNDLDKIYDFLQLSKWEFLESYSYLKEEDYDLSAEEFNEDRVRTLALLMRDAENMLIEENTEMGSEEDNPYKNWNVTGEQLKSAVYDYVTEHLTEQEQQDFEDTCIAWAC